MENAENLRDFFKVALFFPAGKDPWGNLRDFFKVALFFHAGKDPWRMGGKLRDFFKVALFFPAGKDPGEQAGESSGFFQSCTFFPGGKGSVEIGALCSRQISTYVEFVPGFFDIKNLPGNTLLTLMAVLC